MVLTDTELNDMAQGPPHDRQQDHEERKRLITEVERLRAERKFVMQALDDLDVVCSEIAKGREFGLVLRDVGIWKRRLRAALAPAAQLRRDLDGKDHEVAELRAEVERLHGEEQAHLQRCRVCGRLLSEGLHDRCSIG